MPEEELTDVGRGITICHQSFGDPADPTLLLVMGLGMQMVAWHEDFCQGLADRGFHVTRYDNRDTGHSTLFDFRPPSLGQMVARRFPAELHTLLFRRTRVDPALAAGRESLYRRASREAARFCARLEPRLRSLCGREDGVWLAELRRFYRLSDFGKLRHIDLTCATC